MLREIHIPDGSHRYHRLRREQEPDYRVTRKAQGYGSTCSGCGSCTFRRNHPCDDYSGNGQAVGQPASLPWRSFAATGDVALGAAQPQAPANTFGDGAGNQRIGGITAPAHQVLYKLPGRRREASTAEIPKAAADSVTNNRREESLISMSGPRIVHRRIEGEVG